MEKKGNNSYLTFRLANELFAVNVSVVMEIVETDEDHRITYLPKAPQAVAGVVNFRGNVIPVIDTRMKFDLEPYKEGDKHVIMVLNLKINGEDNFVGTLADKVVDVVEISKEDIEDVPKIGQGYNSEYIMGIVHYKNDFVMLLNLEAALSEDAIISIKSNELEAEIAEGN